MALLPFAASQQQAGKSYTPSVNPSKTVLPFAASQQQAKLNPQPTQKPINTPIAKPVAKAQPPSFLENLWNSFTSFFAKAPEVPQLKAGITSPIPEKQMLPQARQAEQGSKIDQGAAFVGNMAGGFINTPVEAGKGVSSLGTHIQQKNSTPGQVAGDIASITMLPLMFLGGEEASTIPGFLKDVANTTAKKAVVQVGKKIATGSIIGGVGGFLGGVQQAQGTTNLKDYVNTIIHNTKLGAGIGAGAEIGGIGAGAVAKNVVVPLAKGASNKLGAIFIKNANSNPKVVHMQLDPKIARSVVVGNEQLTGSPVGRAITRESFVAEQNNQHVGITVDPHGVYDLPGGEKVDVSTVPVYDPTKATYGARDLGIFHNPNLLEPEKKIASDFGTYLSQHYPDAVAQYNALPDTEGGKILSTDTAKELSPAYTKDRTKTMVVQRPAGAFVRQMFADKLKEPVKDKEQSVLFTAGGTGAGKTFAVKYNKAAQEIKNGVDFVYDTNSASGGHTINQIQQVLDSGRKVEIVYVHREPVEAYEKGVLPRAMETGRTVTPEMHIKTHTGALATIAKIADHFKGNPNVAINVIDNSKGATKGHVISLDNLRVINYNKDELRNQLHESLKKQYETNQISESVYRASQDTSTQEHNGAISTEAKSSQLSGENAKANLSKESIRESTSNGSQSEHQRSGTSGESNGTSEESARSAGREPGSSLESRKINEQSPNGNAAKRSATESGAGTNTTTSEAPTVKGQQQQKGLTAQEPVGQGKVKLSSHHAKLAERLAETDPEAYLYMITKNGEVKYNVNKAVDDLEKAADIIEKDPQKAYDIAMGYRPAPEGQTANAIAVTLEEQARKDKNYEVMSNIANALTRRATRAGQENAALKGAFDDNSAHAYIKQLLDTRLNKIGKKSNITSSIDIAKRIIHKSTMSTKERAIAKIDIATEKLQKQLRKQQVKIQKAQNILDELTCK